MWQHETPTIQIPFELLHETFLFPTTGYRSLSQAKKTDCQDLLAWRMIHWTSNAPPIGASEFPETAIWTMWHHKFDFRFSLCHGTGRIVKEIACYVLKLAKVLGMTKNQYYPNIKEFLGCLRTNSYPTDICRLFKKLTADICVLGIKISGFMQLCRCYLQH